MLATWQAKSGENFCLPRGKPRVESFVIVFGTWRKREESELELAHGGWKITEWGIGTWREETEWVLTGEKK